MPAIINAELVLRDHLLPEAVLLIKDGEIAAGKRADLIFADEKMNVKKVIPGGKVVRG